MAGETLVYFGHHRCATQYIKAVVKDVADWLGLTFSAVDRPVEPPTGGPDGTTRHRLHIKHQSYAEPAADILYSARMNDWRQQLAVAPSLEEGLVLELEFEAANFANLSAWDYINPYVFETRYEALIADPLMIFTQALSFWGLTMSRPGLSILAPMVIQRWLRWRTRQAMPRRVCLPRSILQYILAQHAFARKTGGRVQGQEDTRHHYRKGVAGDWRNYFTPRVTAAFKERYGDLLVQLSYESALDW